MVVGVGMQPHCRREMHLNSSYKMLTNIQLNTFLSCSNTYLTPQYKNKY